MPIPYAVARFNRHATNRVTGHIAGWLPGFAIVVHTGRRSGRIYRTPVNAFRGGGGYRIALTYGAESDWVRNVMAAGDCQIETRRKCIALVHPQIVGDPSQRWAPPVVRWVLGAIGASQYMQLTAADATQRASSAIGNCGESAAG